MQEGVTSTFTVNYNMSLVFELKIINEKGLHARASAKFVEVCEAFHSTIEVSHNNFTVSGDSIMGLLTLGAAQGSTISLKVEGNDQKELKDALTNLVEAKFYEET